MADGGLVHALHGVSFDLYRGRTLAIVGESGSGKSVTVQAVMGILPKKGRITRGEIIFRDPPGSGAVDIATIAARRREDARHPRRAHRHDLPGADDIVVASAHDRRSGQRGGAHPSPADAAQAATWPPSLLDKVGFQHPREQLSAYPFELSGGMRQRAMIAMALMCKPAILIADEPTTALDVTTQANILSLIKGSRKQFDMGILLITHDLGVVANVAEDVAVMYRGEVMERGDVRCDLPRCAAPLSEGADPRRADRRQAAESG